MSKNNYETLRDIVLYELYDLKESKEITRQDIINSLYGLHSYKQKRDSNYSLSKEQLDQLQAELEYHFNVSISERDHVLYNDCGTNITWWTGSGDHENDYYWKSYKQYLIEKEKLPENVITRISERSNTIMNHLFNPKATPSAEKYGIVIGSVQSGKTANYISLISKAADAGFKIIIVIAGSTSVLRQQTQIRIDKAFVGWYDTNYDDRKAKESRTEKGTVAEYREKDKQKREKHRPGAMTASKIDSDFNTASAKGLFQTNLNNTTVPLVFVVKKNTTVLSQVEEWLDNKDTSTASLLLIDDEADNASINTRKNYQEETTAINNGIRRILGKFNKRAYVGFTATPFANVFIDPLFQNDSKTKDLFPKDFIIALESPDDYLGPNKFFCEDTESEYVIKLPDSETDEAMLDWEQYFPVSQKKGVSCTHVDGIPQSLKDAILNFAFNIVIRNLRGFEKEHNSMLIHVSRLIDMHEAIANQVRLYLERIHNKVSCFYMMKSSIEYQKYIIPLKNLFIQLTKDKWCSNKDYGVYSFDEVLMNLPEALSSITVRTANTTNNGIVYSSKHQTNVIAIGGNALARGFTLTNLSVSYFIRNTSLCDTLLQMGRWFGYRYRYADLCRVYIPDQFAANFTEAGQAYYDLTKCIGELEKSKETPDHFLITISQHPATQMMLTARNKMRNASNDKGVYLDGRLSEKGTFLKKEIAESNYKLRVANFLYDLGNPVITPNDSSRCYLWNNIHAMNISKLIKDCPKAFNSTMDISLLQEYVNQNAKFKWRLVLSSLVSLEDSSALYSNNSILETYQGKANLNCRDICIRKGKRFNKNNQNNDSYSFAVSGQEHEIMGLLDYEKKHLGKNPTRRECREARKEPLLIINIVDLYDKKTEEAKLIEKDFPLFSLSFPGSFSNPVFKPLLGFHYNKAINEKLRQENMEEENSDDLDEEDNNE